MNRLIRPPPIVICAARKLCIISRRNFMQHTVLGIKTAVSPKTNKRSSTLYLSSPFTEYEIENAEVCIGESVSTEWTTLDVSALKVGSLVELMYTKTATGKALLSGIKVLK